LFSRPVVATCQGTGGKQGGDERELLEWLGFQGYPPVGLMLAKRPRRSMGLNGILSNWNFWPGHLPVASRVAGQYYL
jgi:hypothetical protein